MHWLPYPTCDLESWMLALNFLKMLYPFELVQHDVPPESFKTFFWDPNFTWVLQRQKNVTTKFSSYQQDSKKKELQKER